MPLEGDTVIKTCSDAMTPAVPPIYTHARLGPSFQLQTGFFAY